MVLVLVVEIKSRSGESPTAYPFRTEHVTVNDNDMMLF
jgi:hypothetical protein